MKPTNHTTPPHKNGLVGGLGTKDSHPKLDNKNITYHQTSTEKTKEKSKNEKSNKNNQCTLTQQSILTFMATSLPTRTPPLETNHRHNRLDSYTNVTSDAQSKFKAIGAIPRK